MKWTFKLLRSLALYSTAKMIKDRMARYAPGNVRRHREMLEFYAQFVKKGDLCFDIGANIGSKTAVFLALGARVICVEPQPSCLQQLYRSFRKNENVVIIGQAVGGREGYGELAICEEAPAISTLSNKWRNEGRFSRNHQWTRTERVPMTTLDALILSYGLPAFCKIDVEGYEEPVLRGLTRPIPVLSFEFTREFFADAQRCIDRLLSLGRAEFNCTIGESMTLLFPIWATADELYERLDQPGGELLCGDIYARFSS